MSPCRVSNEFLCSHSLFGGLSDEELERIRPILKEAHYSKGSYLLKQGEENHTLFFIVEGKVSIEKQSKKGNSGSRQITELARGDSFGEMELIDVQPCAASAVAVEDTLVVTLTNSDLYRLSKTNLKTYTILVLNLAREISRRLRVTDEKLASLLYSRS